MLFKTHLSFGIFIFFITFNFIGNEKWIFFIGILFGILIVDIDCYTSKMGKIKIFRPFQIFIKHRGFIHSIFFGFILMIIMTIIHIWFSIGFFVGFLSHLFLDSLTIGGVMIFWPFSKRRIRFIIKSGGFIEEIIFIILCVFIFVFLTFYFLEIF
jgi:inner membrane protein